MNYVSTRGRAPEQNFKEMILSGLASDGGLYVPESFPLFSAEEQKKLIGKAYPEVVREVVRPFIEPEIPEPELKRLIENAFRAFPKEDPLPLRSLTPETRVLELFRGPTLAFKDFSLQFLGQFLDSVLGERGIQNTLLIGATSGDTGSAAIEGFRRSSHVRVCILFPDGGVSEFQRLQMTTVNEPHIHSLAIQGSFDDCQNIVKALFRRREELSPLKPGAVNSINWGRILFQIPYYFYAFAQNGFKPADIVVPTGNFGNIFAGYAAREMGLPIQRLIMANNRNDILHRALQNNDYRLCPVVPTLSPSMDISISSNFERLLFLLCDRKAEEIRRLMEGLKSQGKIRLSEEVWARFRRSFGSASFSDEDILRHMKETFRRYGYAVDPHTATGIGAAAAYPGPKIVLSTAHPDKFSRALEQAGLPFTAAERLEGYRRLQERYTRLPAETDAVKDFLLSRFT